MDSHEDKGMERRLPGRARLATAVMTLLGALVFGVPGVASAAGFGARSCSAAPARAPISITVTQNASMIVDVSGASPTAVDAVSWGDVSWSDLALAG
jgi:hypothetical protein